MKRILIGALTTAMVLSLGVTGASAYGWRPASGTGACGYGCHYVDADGDGACDYRGSSCPYANTTESSVTGYAVGLGHHGGRWG